MPKSLKEVLIPVVTDQSLSTSERSNLLLPIAKIHIDMGKEEGKPLEQIFDEWNSTIADIVEEYNLQRN